MSQSALKKQSKLSPMMYIIDTNRQNPYSCTLVSSVTVENVQGAGRRVEMPTIESQDLSLRPYKYLPLRDGEIRLLVLASGKANQPLQGAFKVVSLGQHVAYQAISYAWGDAVLARQIDLGSGQLGITLSLDGALRRLRPPPWKNAITLWADALCINQRDDVEKSRQVSMMYSIYSRAQSVAVWLGPNTLQDADAFWIMDMMDLMLRKVSPLVKNRQAASLACIDEFHVHRRGSYRMPRCSCCGHGQQRGYRSPESIRLGMAALASLMRRPYFTRLWVVQELIAGSGPSLPIDGDSHWRPQKSLVIYCGSHSIPYASLVNAIRNHNWLPTSTLPTTWASAMSRMTDLDQLMQSLQTDGNQAGRLLDTMFAVKDMACADSRDRVFAFRAMTGVEDVPMLYPTYNTPSEIVWQRTATYLLTQPGTTYARSPAEVLALASTPDEVLARTRGRSTPTWAPSFDHLSFDSSLKHVNYGFDPMESAAGGSDLFTARYDASNTGLLQVRGRIIARISAILPDSYYNRAGNLMQMSKFWGRIETFLIPWFARGHNFLDTVGKPETADCMKSGSFLRQGTPDGSHAGTMISQLAWLIRYDAVNATLPEPCRLDSRSVLDSLSSLLKVMDLRSDSKAAAEAMIWSSDEWIDCTRLLGCTSRGEGCWIPGSARVGDRICVLQGAPYPFVLRLSATALDQYTVVGDAYVHGIMKGEAWTDDAGLVEDVVLE